MSKTSKKKNPKPKYEFWVTFKKYGKTYRTNVKLFSTNLRLNNYYNGTVSPSYRDTNGVLAGAIFAVPTHENKNNVGEIIFSLDMLHPSIVAHESAHIAFQYFEYTHGLDFGNRRREETFCDVLEAIVDGVYKFLIDNKLPFKSLPQWRL